MAMVDAPRKPHFATRFLLAAIFLPLGFIVRWVTAIYMELTWEAVYYGTVFAAVIAGHVLLLWCVVRAIVEIRKRSAAFFAAGPYIVGYGLASLVLLFVDKV